MSVILTNEQQKVVEDFKQFMHSNEKFFLLAAPAGTGKTFLTKYLYSNVYRKDPALINKYACVFTATTHKAAEALTNQLNSTGNTNKLPLEAITIHSLLGLEVNYDLNKGETLLKLRDNAHIIYNSIIFVDECSMIDKTLLKFINCRVCNSKVIFIGDDKQLPPVKCNKVPPVFEMPNLEKHTLTKPMRNLQHEELVELCSQLRERIATNEVKPIVAKDNIIYLPTKKFESKLKEDFINSSVTRRILAYTNKQVNYYNNLIAKFRGKPQYYNEGDCYVLADTARCRHNTKVDAGLCSSILPVDTEVRIMELEDLTYDDMYDIKYYRARVKIPYLDVDGNERKDSPETYMYIPESYETYKSLLSRLKTKASKEKDEFTRKSYWRDYFRAKELFVDLRYRDASTVHKAQGATLKDVYIDLSDLGTCTNADTFNKLLYVAVSRAKEHVYLTGSLPTKYGSVVF